MKTRILAAAFLILGTTLKAQTLQDAIKYMDGEQYERAGAALKKIIAGDPNNGDNYFWYGENYFKTENLDSAKIMYETGLKKNPSNALCMVGVGKILWFQGKNDEAKKMFYSAGVVIADKSNKTLTAQQRAVVCLKIAETYIIAPNKDITEAINQINKAATFDQKNILVKIYMGDALYEKNLGNSTEAIAEYKKAIEMDKNSVVPYFKKGVIYFQAKNGEAAITELDNALKLDSMFAPAWRVKGDVYYFMNKLDKASACYQKYLSINKGNLSARVRNMAFLYLLKKYNECIAEGEQLKKEGSTSNLINRLMGYSYLALDNCAKAIELLDLYFQKQPESNVIVQDYENYAKAQQKCGKDSIAVIWYKKALVKDSTKTDYWTEIGNIYKKAKKYPEAIIAYNEKVKRGGKNVTVNDWFFLGQAYYYNNQYGKADTAFAKYCEGQKEISYGYMWRARANAQLDPDNKTWGAKPYYELAILKSKPDENKKDMDEAYFYMGLYYYKSMKDLASAKCCFQKVVELNVNPDKTKKGEESHYVLAKNTLESAEFKSATASTAVNCIKQ
jgi:tetratricopeptide (TPR) repeat protein